MSQERSSLEYIKKGEKILDIHFMSLDLKVNNAILCKNIDIFAKAEKKLYEIYPEYKEYNNIYFTVGGRTVLRFKTMDENSIKNGDKILLNFYLI